MTALILPKLDYSVAIFTAREDIAILEQSIRALLIACGDSTVMVNILVNGNRALADHAVKRIEYLRLPSSTQIKLWFIPLGDKAHAWNEYLYRIAPSAPCHIFIDGYASVQQDALQLIQAGLINHPNALAVTGVPSMGRSADRLREQMLRDGGIHGNLYALRGATVETLAQRGFHLPLGIYRTDPLVAAVLCFGLEPARHQWDSSRILVQDGATWTLEPMTFNRIEDWIAHYRRLIRQAQGHLEVMAIRSHLAERLAPPEALPRTVLEMIEVWASLKPDAFARALRFHPLSRHALRKLREPRDWSVAQQAPLQLVSAGVLK